MDTLENLAFLTHLPHLANTLTHLKLWCRHDLPAASLSDILSLRQLVQLEIGGKWARRMDPKNREQFQLSTAFTNPHLPNLRTFICP